MDGCAVNICSEEELEMFLHLKFVSHDNLVTKTYCIRGWCHLGIAKACRRDIRLDAMEKRGLVAIITTQ